MYNENKRGPQIEPCVTPHTVILSEDVSEPCSTPHTVILSEDVYLYCVKFMPSFWVISTNCEQLDT
jgi:hypothetical protein